MLRELLKRSNTQMESSEAPKHENVVVAAPA